jgi:hypothetical protein
MFQRAMSMGCNEDFGRGVLSLRSFFLGPEFLFYVLTNSSSCTHDTSGLIFGETCLAISSEV